MGKIYKSKNLKEEERQRYCWEAYLKNGRRVYRYDDRSNSLHSIKELDEEIVDQFAVIDSKTGHKEILFNNGNSVPVFFYRNIKPDFLKNFVRVIVFGFKNEKEEGYRYIMPGGEIVSFSGYPNLREYLKKVIIG